MNGQAIEILWLLGWLLVAAIATVRSVHSPSRRRTLHEAEEVGNASIRDVVRSRAWRAAVLLRAGVLCLAAAFGAPPVRDAVETGSAFSAVLAAGSLVLCGMAATLLWNAGDGV